MESNKYAKLFYIPYIHIALALIAITIIPKKEIHRLAIYGIFSGAVMDIFAILIVWFIGNGGYINYGPFGFLGIPFFPPIAWTILSFYDTIKSGQWSKMQITLGPGY